MNVHAPSEEKTVDSEESINAELQQVFEHSPKYHTNILLGDFTQKWGQRIFSNHKFGMRVYIGIVMIKVLRVV